MLPGVGVGGGHAAEFDFIAVAVSLGELSENPSLATRSSEVISVCRGIKFRGGAQAPGRAPV